VKIVRLFLMGLGLVFAGLLLFLGVLFATNGPSRTPAPKERLAGLINRSGLDPNVGYTVVASEDAGFMGGGDHEFSHCLQLSDFTVRNGFQSEWFTGPVDNPVTKGVVGSAARKARECFPAGIEVDSAAVRMRIDNIEYRHPDLADEGAIFLYEPTSKRLLYYSFRT
jgi:hypothetical protein